MTFTTFFFLSLAALRHASLIANENGPWHVFERFRQLAEYWCKKYKFCSQLSLHELVTCKWCNSVWIGFGLTLLCIWIGGAILYLALPFALSTVVIIIKYTVQTLQAGQQYFETARVNE